LFGETASAAFVVPIPNTTPSLVVAAGEREQILELLDSCATAVKEVAAARTPPAASEGDGQ